jgi:photosystem II stability/assembly factor-like uncharacterized protein
VVPLLSDHYRVVPDAALKVWRSSDRGRVWKALTNGLPQEHCYVGVLRNAMVADPLDPAGVYFGTSGGEVYVSNNAGESWNCLPARLPRITCINVK